MLPKRFTLNKITALLLEGTGIVLSILVAFGIDNWDEERRKEEKEIIYLKGLHSDMIKDQNQLTRRISDYKIKLATTVELLENLATDDEIDQPKVIRTVDDKLAYLFAYVPSNNTYKALESSGDIKFISNAELKLLLFELDKSFETNQQKGELFMDYSNGKMWAGFLLDHFDYRKGTTNLDEAQLRLELFNRVRRYNKLIESYYYDMQGTLLKIDQVRMALEEEMKHKDIMPEVKFEELGGTDKEKVEKEEEELEDLLEEL